MEPPGRPSWAPRSENGTRLQMDRCGSPSASIRNDLAQSHRVVGWAISRRRLGPRRRIDLGSGWP